MKHFLTLLLSMLLALPAVAMAAAHAPMPNAAMEGGEMADGEMASECHETAEHPKPGGKHEGAMLSVDCLGCAVTPASVRPLAQIEASAPIPYRATLTHFQPQHDSGLDPPPPRIHNRNNI